MSFIAFIVNPISGSDVRRFSSHASSDSFTEKMNICLRVASAAYGMGVREFVLMPDRSGMAFSIKQKLEEQKIFATIDDMQITGKTEDTVIFADRMAQRGCACLVALGGDGTSRAAAKSCRDTPFISISSGTNNVYPTMEEGTAAGIACAGIAFGKYPLEQICTRDKRIEIFINDEFCDIALIDAAITKIPFIGAKAISDINDIEYILVSRAHPATIGFSSIVGCRRIVRKDDPFGAVQRLHTGEEYVFPLSSGVLQKIRAEEPVILPLEKEFTYFAKAGGTIALDGEREIVYKKDEKLTFIIKKNGPLRVDVIKTCELMLEKRAFMI